MPYHDQATKLFSVFRLGEAGVLLLLALVVSLPAAADCINGATTGDCLVIQRQAQGAGEATDVDTTSVLSVPAASTKAPLPTPTGFYVNQQRSDGEELSEYLLLMVLVAIGLSLLLVRARKLNDK